jgi:hypothetical protein
MRRKCTAFQVNLARQARHQSAHHLFCIVRAIVQKQYDRMPRIAMLQR